MNLFKTLFWQLAPPSYRENDVNNDDVFQNIIKSYAEDIGQEYIDILSNIDDYINPLTCPADFLPWLADWFKFDLLYWADLFDWDTAKQREIVNVIGHKQRYVGSIEGIVWFVENFITNAKVNVIYEPWTNLLQRNKSVYNGADRYPNYDYYRDYTIHITVSQSTDEVEILLRWLIEPRVKIYLTLENNIVLSPDWDFNVLLTHESIHNHLYLPTRVFKRNIDYWNGEKRYNGYPWKFLLSSEEIYGIDNDTWYPLANSIWSIEELTQSYEYIKETLNYNIDEYNSNTVRNGFKEIQNESPVVSSKWNFISLVNNSED